MHLISQPHLTCLSSLSQSTTMASTNHTNPKTLSLIFHLLLSFHIVAITTSSQTPTQKPFFSTSPTSSPHFQPILTDPTSTFSFGFLPASSQPLFVDLAIIHLPSSFPLWRAVPSQPIPFSPSTSLSFNGSLILTNPNTGHLWSTPILDGDALLLLSSSSLQIQKRQPSVSVLWRSFDSPFDTIVQDQNFTRKSALLSANNQFSMRIGASYLALYMEQPGRPMYWKHTVMQAKADIVDGQGSIYARVDPTGFLGLYQNDKVPVDVQSFDTFNTGIKKSLRRLTLESDGNLKAYYWNNSSWISDFVAISELCKLPVACGPYGTCDADGQMCSGCVDNRTAGAGCFEAGSGDFCNGEDKFEVVRRVGVDLANKELIGYEKVSSLAECEGKCESNCTCWGAVYNNVSGYCYRVDYPIQTVLADDNERKVGYFKVRDVGGGERRRRRRRRVGVVLVVVGGLVLVGGCMFAGYRAWKGRRRRSGEEGELGVMMPYKDLKSSSFRSIEMSSSFRK